MSPRPNILVFCIDQWQAHMQLPKDLRLDAISRLESEGVTLERHYCTVPICTSSRASMWTGLPAKHVGLWDNTNFAWTEELSPRVRTIGHMLREQGYYTAFKGKWHLSTVGNGEHELELFGFSDYQQWGDTFGPPLGGATHDCVTAFETVDWLEHRAKDMDKPWFLISSFVNPHDIMFLRTDPVETPHPNGAIFGMQTPVQDLGWFRKQWDLSLPPNFADDYEDQPMAVRNFKEFLNLNYGRVPNERTDLWLARRNYLVNAMRLVDSQMGVVLKVLDELDLWRNTVVILTADHGEMNGAHRMTQKGGIHFDEAGIVNFTVCAPEGPKGLRVDAVGSHLDLVPTLLGFAGLGDEERNAGYPGLKGRNFAPFLLVPTLPAPRGRLERPGDGALICWDGLHQLDNDWAISGALRELTDLSDRVSDASWSPDDRRQKLHDVGRRYGAPDFRKRTFFRAVMDGRFKFVRWFSPLEYGNPKGFAELRSCSDLTLHDLKEDPGELENMANESHPRYDPDLLEHLTAKLHRLVGHEIGDDEAPFDLNLFGTRDVLSA